MTTKATNSILELQNLSIAAGNTPLARGVSLVVAPGERIAVVGPSGSGKTTLLRTVCGLVDPLEGQVLLEGKTGDEWGWPTFRRHVTLMEQRPALRDTSIQENLRLPFTYQSSTATFPETQAREWYERLGLGGADWNRNARELSVGQQQRLCLIRALLLEPRILLLDEPTSALDPEATIAVETLLKTEGERRGLSALIVTHSPEQVTRLCTRTLSLSAYLPATLGAIA